MRGPRAFSPPPRSDWTKYNSRERKSGREQILSQGKKFQLSLRELARATARRA